MNKTIIIFLIVLIVLFGSLYAIRAIDPNREETNDDVSTSTPSEESVATNSTYRDAAIGLSLVYPNGKKGYNLTILPGAGSEHVKTIVLIDSDDYQDLLETDIPREGPPTINIQVYKNEQNAQPRAWADSHTEASNLNLLIGEVKEEAVGGANAIRYTADGLYPTDTIIVAHGSFMYVISGAYVREDDTIKADFGSLLRSVVFIPEPGTE